MFLKGIKFSVLDLDTPKKGSKESSVHYGSQYRFNKAVQQAKLKPVSINKIINHVNKVLDVLGIDKVEKPIFKISGNRINYDNIIGTEVNNKSDLVWLKFTKDGYLGVVAAGRDINFDIPTSEEEYNIKKGKQWEYNTSGIIIHKLGKEWDKNFVLVFPLKNNHKGHSRRDVEKAIGDYLIKKKVPILDYYSHRL